MQPYFMPYIGYWQLMNMVDKYVVYDDVNYINRGWINRNRILINGQEHLFTISLKNASQNKLINDIEIADDFSKIQKQIAFSYKKAPYYQHTNVLLQDIFSFPNKNLSDFLYHSIATCCNYLGIKTEIIKSSCLTKDNTLRAENKILHICKIMGATEYYNAIGGQELYNRDVFMNNGIELKFLKSDLVPYKQFANDFVPGLSIIDVLMFNSVEEIKRMLNQYELV
jgi:hypothetical protein